MCSNAQKCGKQNFPAPPTSPRHPPCHVPYFDMLKGVYRILSVGANNIKTKKLWDKYAEKEFFLKSMKFAAPEQLFYITNTGEYLAYWPKGYKGKKATLQSRNSLIGKFTEKWVTDMLQSSVEHEGLYAIQGARCAELGLSNRSPADAVISKCNGVDQKPGDILLIVEVKMSILWNWRLMKHKHTLTLQCIGDYNSHQGNPGLLRSDSMLKAIGKSTNIRAASLKSSAIPIIIIGNTPITRNYYDKVDHLKRIGFVQGFWSVNPKPINSHANIKSTGGKGFYRFDELGEFKTYILNLIKEERHFFSSMKGKEELGKIIERANEKTTYKEKAEEFLRIIGG